MSYKVTVDGARYCGKVTINGTVLADKIMACHFTDCRKFSGTLFRAVAVISAEQVAITGAVKEYLKIADSGNERVQEFCDNCGSQIYAADPAKTLFMVLTVVCPNMTSLRLRSIFLANLWHHGLAQSKTSNG